MPGNVSTVARYVFLLHFIASLVFGAFWFLAPAVWNSITGWPNEVAAGRMLGAATLMVAIGSFLAYRASSWQQVEIYVEMELVFNLLGLLGMVWNVQTMTTLPTFTSYSLIGMLVFFSVAFLYVFFTAEERKLPSR